MQFNAASTSSSFAAASATAATHNYFGAAVDIDGFKIPQIPLAGPGNQPIIGLNLRKNPASPTLMKTTSRLFENNLFPSPGSSTEDGNADGRSLTPVPHRTVQPVSRLVRSVAPSPAPTTLLQIHKDIEQLYVLEEEQAEEIRDLAKDVLVEAFKICLSTPGDLAIRYRSRIAELLGEGAGRRVVEDVEDMKETGRLPTRTPSWDMGNLGTRRQHFLDSQEVQHATSGLHPIKEAPAGGG
ncbi:hypothetical protein NLJ89_g11190 [Agrocybe chaxingu]|uniref:Uncharacterized protein n=1 Tax=Agrocybe chaxingu TaxID=84603 RepID=A0A9W8JWR6_9AGAR|nr:hypothetical protein NLJ89_g11190 [Agrocybe chaxingu]